MIFSTSMPSTSNERASIQSYADAGTLKYDSRFASCKAAIDLFELRTDHPKVNEQCGQVFVGVRRR